MLKTGTYNNLPLFAGDTFDLPMNWKDGNGDLFPLNGWGGRLVFLISPYQDIALLEIDQTNGVTMQNVSPNIHCVIDKAITSLIEVAPVFYFFEVTDPTGVTDRLMEGTVLYKDLLDK